MKELSTSRKQLYMGMILLVLIALLLMVKMVVSDTPVPSGITYQDENETTVNGFTNQETIVVPEGVTTIDGQAISGKKYDKVRTLALPTTLEDIADVESFGAAFPNVEEIVVGTDSSCQGYYYADGILYQKIEGKVSYGLYAFEHLAKGTVVMPNTVQCIKSDLFASCAQMTSLTFGSEFGYVDHGDGNYERINGTCFDGCTGLKEIQVINGNAFYRSENASLYCKDVDRGENADFADWMLLVVPRAYEGKYSVAEGVVTVGAGAFYECDRITEVHISMGVTEIKEHAFVGCDRLSVVTVPATVQYMRQPFDACDELAAITFTGGIYYEKLDYEDLLCGNSGLQKIYVPKGCKEQYVEILSKREARRIKVGDYEPQMPSLDELEQPSFYVTTKEDGGIYFEWKQVPYAKGYYLQKDMGGYWETIRTLRRSHSCYFHTLTMKDVGMEEGKIYRFRVVAYADEITRVSKKKSTCYIRTPELIALKNKESESLYVRWETNQDVSGYYVEVSKGNEIVELLHIEDALQGSVTVRNLKKDEVYQVKVYAYKEIEGEKIYSGYSSDTKNVAL